jgi:hypothetical protein
MTENIQKHKGKIMEERMNRKDVSFGTHEDFSKEDKKYWAKVSAPKYRTIRTGERQNRSRELRAAYRHSCYYL